MSYPIVKHPIVSPDLIRPRHEFGPGRCNHFGISSSFKMGRLKYQLPASRGSGLVPRDCRPSWLRVSFSRMKAYHDFRSQKPHDPGHEARRAGRRDPGRVSPGCSPTGCLLRFARSPHASQNAGCGLRWRVLLSARALRERRTKQRAELKQRPKRSIDFVVSAWFSSLSISSSRLVTVPGL